MTTPRQIIHLSAIARDYPGVWQQVEAFRLHPPMPWPDWCFLPMAAAHAIVTAGGNRPLTMDRATDIARIAALGAWRITQGIYRFDPDLYQAISTTPPEGPLPMEILQRMPEWCIYVEVTDPELHGFYAHLEWDVNTGRTELRLLLDDDRMLTPVPIHLGEGWTLEDGIADALHESYVRAAGRGIVLPAGSLEIPAGRVAPLVSLLLYLCSANAEYRDARGSARMPGRPAPVCTRHGPRLFAASGPTVWETGWRIGAAIRQAREHEASPSAGSGGRASPRPHVRRAHWHLYWTGPRSGPQKPALKWLPPIAVRTAAADIVPTVHPVRR